MLDSDCYIKSNNMCASIIRGERCLASVVWNRANILNRYESWVHKFKRLNKSPYGSQSRRNVAGRIINTIECG